MPTCGSGTSMPVLDLSCWVHRPTGVSSQCLSAFLSLAFFTSRRDVKLYRICVLRMYPVPLEWNLLKLWTWLRYMCPKDWPVLWIVWGHQYSVFTKFCQSIYIVYLWPVQLELTIKAVSQFLWTMILMRSWVQECASRGANTQQQQTLFLPWVQECCVCIVKTFRGPQGYISKHRRKQISL